MIISTLLIEYTGLTIFDPIASLFIAALIVASVIPLVMDSGRILCLELAPEKAIEIRQALSEVCQDIQFLHLCCVCLNLFEIGLFPGRRRFIRRSQILAQRRRLPYRLHPHPTRALPQRIRSFPPCRRILHHNNERPSRRPHICKCGECTETGGESVEGEDIGLVGIADTVGGDGAELLFLYDLIDGRLLGLVYRCISLFVALYNLR